MSVIKPSTPKGTRDFSPEEVYKRQYILGVIKKHFELYGFQPIETPTMENLSTLRGKYGDEGDNLIFKILNSGDWKKEILAEEFSEKKSSQLISKVSEKGLRYDLTVPFARYVVMHQNEIEFPFKRYQLQTVFRADRPQRGRYREFWQCDADVVGTDSLICEWELIKIYDEVFFELGIPVTIKINNRKILNGIAEVIGASEKFQDMTIAIDKLDKIGIDSVKKELTEKRFLENQISVLEKFFQLNGTCLEKLNQVEEMISSNETGKKGVAELKKILFDFPLSTKNKIEIDFTLARGLNYYTGTILEVKAEGVQMGSIGGGGRYDDLTGMFGLKNISGVGISFGLDRIYDVLEELKKFPATVSNGTKILFVNFDEKSENYCLPWLQKLREAGIASEIYPSAAKMAKQMKYADARKIPFVILAGENEMKEGKLTLKNMQSGEQKLFSIEEIISEIKS